MRNAKQEILDALNRLGSSIQEFRPDQYKELRAINKILETHELVPVVPPGNYPECGGSMLVATLKTTVRTWTTGRHE